MGTLRLSLWFVIACSAAVSTGAESKPNFSGVWKLLDADPLRSEIIEQNESELRVFRFTEDRWTMVKRAIDGQPHSQIVDGDLCDFLARWKGNALYFETKRDTHGSTSAVVQMLHLMRLAAGKTMSLTRTIVTRQPGTVREKWERQDPLPREIFLTGFDRRLKLDADRNSIAGHDVQCSQANAFNDVSRAEQECLAIINKESVSKFHGDARVNLAEVYWRNGMVRKALGY